MAAEYSAIALQTVAGGQPILFTEDRVPDTSGYIFHQNGSGVILLSSMVQTPVSPYRRRIVYESLYQISFSGNIAVPTDGTVGEIILAISIEGEPDGASYMRYTPAAVDVFGNVSSSTIVPVPSVCKCSSVSIRNITVNGEPIDVQNANVIIKPVGIQVAN